MTPSRTASARRSTRGQRDGRRAARGSGSISADAPAAAGDEQAQHGVAGLAAASSVSTSARTASASNGRRRFARRARHALEVLVERERPPAVEADDLEDAVAAQQPLVGDRDARLGGGHDRAVEDREHARSLPGARRSAAHRLAAARMPPGTRGTSRRERARASSQRPRRLPVRSAAGRGRRAGIGPSPPSAPRGGVRRSIAVVRRQGPARRRSTAESPPAGARRGPHAPRPHTPARASAGARAPRAPGTATATRTGSRRCGTAQTLRHRRAVARMAVEELHDPAGLPQAARGRHRHRVVDRRRRTSAAVRGDRVRARCIGSSTTQLNPSPCSCSVVARHAAGVTREARWPIVRWLSAQRRCTVRPDMSDRLDERELTRLARLLEAHTGPVRRARRRAASRAQPRCPSTRSSRSSATRPASSCAWRRWPTTSCSSRSGLTRLVDRLVCCGLLERRACPSDAARRPRAPDAGRPRAAGRGAPHAPGRSPAPVPLTARAGGAGPARRAVAAGRPADRRSLSPRRLS